MGEERQKGLMLREISRSDLSDKTHEVFETVRHGHPAVVLAAGREEVVLLDATDYHLLRAFADWAASSASDSTAAMPATSAAMSRYLNETISLGKLAELLELPRFELQDRMHRLGIPLRLGPATLEELEADFEVARKLSAAT
jgi:prevent-host-death family protein